MSDEVIPITVKIRRRVYEEFRNYLLRRYGRVRGVMGVELENAILEYLEKKVGKREETKVGKAGGKVDVEELVKDLIELNIDPDSTELPVVVEKLLRRKYGVVGTKSWREEVTKTVRERLKFLRKHT